MSTTPSRSLSRRTALAAALATAAASQIVSAPFASAKVAYDRQKAATYARGRVYDDPSQIQFENGCAWYVSRVLWVGGIPMTNDWTDSTMDVSKVASKKPGFYPGPTKTAADANYLKDYLVNSGVASIHELNWRQNDVPGAALGDVIGYDWDGGADGSIDHVMVITNFSGKYPLVSGHSEPRLDAGWTWSEKYHNWIEQTPEYHGPHGGPRAYLLHINT